MLSPENVYQICLPYCGPLSDAKLYLLVDHAGMPGLVQMLVQTHSNWRSLFEGSKEENALSVAPILFSINLTNEPLKRCRLLNWVCQNGIYTSSVILMISPLPIDVLAARLRQRLEATIPDNMEVLLRYFDPRIFESLCRILSKKQKEDFLNVAACWWYTDRIGELREEKCVFSEFETSDISIVLTSSRKPT
jgi:hypothetical protein